jgi:intein-encoded DNA endonuclease-like protein
MSQGYHRFEYIDEKIAGGLSAYLRRAREEGTPYRTIASDLTKDTGISVSKSAVARWITAK